MKPELTSQKLRGGYYTPAPIAEFLAQWAIRSAHDTVLEPSCGDGNILIAAAQTLLQHGATPVTVAESLYGIELDPQEAAQAGQQLASFGISGNCVHVGDFFRESQTHFFDETFFTIVMKERRRFDVVIGNPPFIRYQNFPEDSRKIAFRLMERAGLHPNRLTNTWLPFLVVSSLLLTPQGRLAMVIPAELFQVNYAAEVRKFLSDYFSQLTMITFKQLVFEGIQQEVVLLLGERDSSENGGIRAVELRHIDDLQILNHEEVLQSECKPLDHSTEKWTQYFLSSKEIQLLRTLREHPNITLSGRVIDVDVGVVTGNNDFFIITRNQAQQNQLDPHVARIVVRSGHLQGAIFSDADWLDNERSQRPALLFTCPDKPIEELPPSLQTYLTMGKQAGFTEGYKCRIRKRWYLVPSVWIPDAFMLRQVHGYSKLILNMAGATCTDTIHRVRFRDGADGKTITAAFLNSLTFAFAEVTGRSYGGGVLTFEPTECERLPLPLRGAESLDLKFIDERVRKDDIDAVLDVTDRLLLVEQLGLGVKEVRMLRGIWEKLRNRRIRRKHTSLHNNVSHSDHTIDGGILNNDKS